MSMLKRLFLLEPSSTEIAILGCLCLLSPGSLKHLIPFTEQKEIDNIQEALFQILRVSIKCGIRAGQLDEAAGRRKLAAFVSILSDLKTFHLNNMRTWEKFLTFKPKIIENCETRVSIPKNMEDALVKSIKNIDMYAQINSELTI